MQCVCGGMWVFGCVLDQIFPRLNARRTKRTANPLRSCVLHEHLKNHEASSPAGATLAPHALPILYILPPPSRTTRSCMPCLVSSVPSQRLFTLKCCCKNGIDQATVGQASLKEQVCVFPSDLCLLLFDGWKKIFETAPIKARGEFSPPGLSTAKTSSVKSQSPASTPL